MRASGFTVFIFLLILLAAGCGRTSADRAEIDLVRESAQAYFEAEVAGDLEGVYYRLAPSSRFRQSYTFENYTDIMAGQPVRVVWYRIEDVGNLVRKPDVAGSPLVEMTAEVTVLVGLKQGDNGETLERRSVLIFIKENGSWYKG